VDYSREEKVPYDTKVILRDEYAPPVVVSMSPYDQGETIVRAYRPYGGDGPNRGDSKESEGDYLLIPE